MQILLLNLSKIHFLNFYLKIKIMELIIMKFLKKQNEKKFSIMDLENSK